MLANSQYEHGRYMPGEASEGCWIARSRVPLHHDHGLFGLSACLHGAPSDLALVARDPRLAHFDARRAIFLAMREGPRPGTWLMGMVRIVGETFFVEQVACNEAGQERAALTAVARRIGLADWSVSFSRSSFDRFALQQRMAEFGVPFPFPIQRHLKLLGPLKAIYGPIAAPCCLTQLERQCLSLHREQTDSPFHSNLLDLLSLAGLLGHVSRALRAPALPQAAAAASMAAWALGRWDEAARWGGAAVRSGAETARLPLARSLTRLGRMDEATPHWEILGRGGRSEACEVMARFEARSGHHASALLWCERGLRHGALTSGRERRLRSISGRILT